MAKVKDTYLTKLIQFELTDDEHARLMRHVENKYHSKKALRRYMRFLIHSVIYTTHQDKTIR